MGSREGVVERAAEWGQGGDQDREYQFGDI